MFNYSLQHTSNTQTQLLAHAVREATRVHHACRARLGLANKMKDPLWRALVLKEFNVARRQLSQAISELEDELAWRDTLRGIIKMERYYNQAQ